MDRTALHALVDRLADVEADGVAGLDREAAGGVLAEMARLRAWAEHLRLGVVARVAELSPTPERDIADADGSSTRGAARDITTAQTLGGGALGGAAESLAAGATTRGHVDVLADAFRSLDTEGLRQRFRGLMPTLDAMAKHTPLDAFARHVRQIVDRLRREAGDDRLTQQRRNTRLSIRTDIVSGMVLLDGRFDPRTGLALRNRLEEIRDQLAASGEADGADTPTDPMARQGWLLAQALARLVQGTAAPARRPEISIVVDARRVGASRLGGMAGGAGSAGGIDLGVSDGGSPGSRGTDVAAIRAAAPATAGADASSGAVSGAELLDEMLRAASGGEVEIDWGAEVELPLAEVRAVAEQAVVRVVTTDGDAVVDAPGRLRLGRSTRLASADQRRVLRALYPRCAIPDCPVPFDRCDVHHVVPWEQGGPTDLDNLLPVCAHHHQTLHTQRWRLELGADRVLTVTLPDQRILRAGPPHRGAA